MRTTRFLLTIIASGALTHGASVAGEPSKQPAEKELRQNNPASDHSINKDQPDRPHSLLNNTGRAFERNNQPGPLQTQTKRVWGNELHQPALKKAAAANGGLMMNKVESHHEQPVKWPKASGTAASGSGLSRSRSATPAGLGGLPGSRAKNSTTALDGTSFKRKP